MARTDFESKSPAGPFTVTPDGTTVGVGVSGMMVGVGGSAVAVGGRGVSVAGLVAVGPTGVAVGSGSPQPERAQSSAAPSRTIAVAFRIFDIVMAPLEGQVVSRLVYMRPGYVEKGWFIA